MAGLTNHRSSPKRVIVLTCVLVFTCIAFWSLSRYPSLQNRAESTGKAVITDTLSFRPLIEFTEREPLWNKIFVSTINWVDGNKKGMTFGVIIAGLILALLGRSRFELEPEKR